MKVVIKSLEKNRNHELHDIKQVYQINENYTQCDELKNSILLIHGTGHCEQFRLFKNARIISIED